MPIVPEMDEFFDFEAANAGQPSQQPTSTPLTLDFEESSSLPYDYDMAFADMENDPDSFAALQQFVTGLSNSTDDVLELDMQSSLQDVGMTATDDFNDFSRWIDGAQKPANPCDYCRSRRLECLVIQKDHSMVHECTSCVALHRPCSLQDTDFFQALNNASRNSSSRQLDKLSGSDDQSGAIATHMARRTNSGSSLKSGAPASDIDGTEGQAPKVGSRFTRESIRVLKNWLHTHNRHPYPSDEEKEHLRRETGLNKTQITNWLANARRRNKGRQPGTVSPKVDMTTHPMDIPRKATPAMESMNPLERWQHSPPENEPASVTAIARAVTSSTLSSDRASPYSYIRSEDGSARSIIRASSESSLNTSQSSTGSFASAFSHRSRGSFGSINSYGKKTRRRRRQVPKTVVSQTLNCTRQFQCTFCTESFRTKHDWQRHEKSLHLSLERWVCAPDGPTYFCTENNYTSCIFCGLPRPDEAHLETHNYSACLERTPEERTFYRKDHLNQHLRLVHGCKFLAWSMKHWKVAIPEIKSRCGFCNTTMDTWSARVDHLADHFKCGKTMAEWSGDWGFEPHVVNMVESAMPPYLIHNERGTPYPFVVSDRSQFEAPNTPLNQLRMALIIFLRTNIDNGHNPSDDEIQAEALRFTFGAKAESEIPSLERDDWFQKLIISNDDDEWLSQLRREADLLPSARSIASPGRSPSAAIDPQCQLDIQLMSYVRCQATLSIAPTNDEMHGEAHNIINNLLSKSTITEEQAALYRQQLTSVDFIPSFRNRAGLPPESEGFMIKGKSLRRILNTNPNPNAVAQEYRALEKELANYVADLKQRGIKPTNEQLRSRARYIQFGNEDTWNQTAADSPDWLLNFKRSYGLAQIDEMSEPASDQGDNFTQPAPVSSLSAALVKESSWDQRPNTCVPTTFNDLSFLYMPVPPQFGSSSFGNPEGNALSGPQRLKARFFINDANCYRRLERELSRYVQSCLSPHNPKMHVPNDAEIQHQARWIVYDDDDPWNTTAADNAEWLSRFKRSHGLARAKDGPGLPLETLPNEDPWTGHRGQSGFMPPFINPSPAMMGYGSGLMNMSMDTSSLKPGVPVRPGSQLCPSTINPACEAPATVFCSRKLESELVNYVTDALARRWTPTDDQLRTKAREIMGTKNTAADDNDLLGKFKRMCGIGDRSVPFGADFQEFMGMGMGMGMDGATAFGTAEGSLPGSSGGSAF